MNTQNIPLRLLLMSLSSAFLLTACSNTELSQEPAQPAISDAEALAYQSECKADIQQAKSKFKALENEQLNSTGAFLGEINKLDMMLDKSLSKSSLYRNVHPNEELRTAADQCQQQYIELLTDISLSRALFSKLNAIDASSLDSLDKRFVSHMLRDFKRSGVNLDEQSRKRIRKLNEEILVLGQTFNKNIREDIRSLTVNTVEDLKGMPQDFIDKLARDDQGKPILSTRYPEYFPVMQYADSDELRLAYYKLFRQRGYPANHEVLKNLISKRHELAQTLGYSNYAAYIMDDLMIGNPSNAENFITRVNELAKPQATAEYRQLLRELQKVQPEAKTVGDWQKTYVEERLKSEKYSIDSQLVRQYFSYDNVQAGIFALTEDLFGVEIKNWETEVWHPSVKAYEMYEDGELVGRFYLDMHPRDGKYSHAAAFGIQDGVSGVQPPIAALVCNFPGKDDGSELLEHKQVETFLHEFGHLLHALFGGQNQRWLYFSGIRTERDFVEAPSQMLEEWVWDAQTLKRFAKNAQGETIPDELIEKMNAGRNYGKALWTRHQMFYAALSLNFYNQAPAKLDMTATMKSLQAEYSPYAYVEDTHFYTSFGHLYGYSAIYYTYMWSLVIASDMFGEFEKHGMRNTETAQHYRDTVLTPGGSKDAAELVKDFLGREYSFETFANKLPK